jgi:hypothetical protein
MDDRFLRGASAAAGKKMHKLMSESLQRRKPSWPQEVPAQMACSESQTSKRSTRVEERYAEKHGFKIVWANMTSYNLPNGTELNDPQPVNYFKSVFAALRPLEC